MNKLSYWKYCAVAVVFLTQFAWGGQPDFKKMRVDKAPVELEGVALMMRDFLNAKETEVISPRISRSSFKERSLKLVKRTVKDDSAYLQAQQIVDVASEQVFVKLWTTLTSYDEVAYINYRRYKKSHYITFRLSNDDVDDYIVFQFDNVNGEWSAVDWIFHSTEIWASQGINDLVVIAFSTKRIGDSFLNYVNAVKSDPKNVVSHFEKIPDSLKQQKILISLAFSSMTEFSTQEWLTSAEYFLSHARDKDYILYRLHYWYSMGDYHAALPYAKAHAQMLGGDSGAKLLEAELYYFTGSKKKAMNMLADVFDETKGEDPYYTALALFVNERNYDDALRVMDTLVNLYGASFDRESLSSVESLLPLVRSEAFKIWEANQERT